MTYVVPEKDQTPLRIIGLAGPKYSGKDTVAKGLLTYNDKHKKQIFRHGKMAEGVKNIITEVFGWGPDLYEHPVLKEQKLERWPHIEPRWPMMDIANWMRDQYGGDVWARRWERVTLEHYQDWGAHIISDMRFPEEVEMVQRHGGIIIYISRPEAEQALASAQRAGDEMANNRSESHYDMLKRVANFTVSNDSTPEKVILEVVSCLTNHYDHWSYWDCQDHHDVLELMRTGQMHLMNDQPVANGAR